MFFGVLALVPGFLGCGPRDPESPPPAVAEVRQALVVGTTFVAPGSATRWRYKDDASISTADWRKLSFADAAWAEGPAQLGYGDGDEATKIRCTTASVCPAASTAKFITSYFRRTFTVTNAAAVKSLSLRLIRDDGAVVYLNGVEVNRSNLPTGTIAGTTLASTTIDGLAETTWSAVAALDPALLVTGNNVVAVEIHQVNASSSDVSFDLELTGTVENAGLAIDTLAPVAGNWKYLDTGVPPAAGWKATVFADTTWKTGLAQLGYGDGDEATVVSFGPNANTKFLTTYFRRAFTVANPAIYKNLLLRLQRDDGAVVYLNGVEIHRSNMPAGTVASTTLATATIADGIPEATFETVSVSPSKLLTGTNQSNVLAVEVHQSVATSSDLTFGLELLGEKEGIPAAPTGLVATGISGARIKLTWTDTSINESGFEIERSADKVVFAALATVPAGTVSFIDGSGLSLNKVYDYRVRATNVAGPSAYSNVATATSAVLKLTIDGTQMSVTSYSLLGGPTPVAVVDNTKVWAGSMDPGQYQLQINSGKVTDIVVTVTDDGNFAYDSGYPASMIQGQGGKNLVISGHPVRIDASQLTDLPGISVGLAGSIKGHENWAAVLPKDMTLRLPPDYYNFMAGPYVNAPYTWRVKLDGTLTYDGEAEDKAQGRRAPVVITPGVSGAAPTIRVVGFPVTLIAGAQLATDWVAVTNLWGDLGVAPGATRVVSLPAGGNFGLRGTGYEGVDTWFSVSRSGDVGMLPGTGGVTTRASAGSARVDVIDMAGCAIKVDARALVDVGFVVGNLPQREGVIFPVAAVKDFRILPTNYLTIRPAGSEVKYGFRVSRACQVDFDYDAAGASRPYFAGKGTDTLIFNGDPPLSCDKTISVANACVGPYSQSWDGPLGWTNSPVVVDDPSLPGPTAGKVLKMSGAPESHVSPFIAVEPGEYCASTRIKYAGGPVPLLSLYRYNAGGGFENYVYLTYPNTDPSALGAIQYPMATHDWKTLRQTVQIPAGTPAVRWTVQTLDGSIFGLAYGLVPNFLPNPGATYMDDTALTRGACDFKTYNADNSVATYFTEDWDGPINGWLSPAREGAPEAQDATAPAGPTVHKITRVTGGGDYFSPKFAIAPGQYCGSARVKWVGGGQPFVGYEVFDVAGSTLTGVQWWMGTAAYGTPIPSNAVGWHQYKKTFTVPASGTKMRLTTELWNGSGKPGTNEAYFDDVKVTAGACPDLCADAATRCLTQSQCETAKCEASTGECSVIPAAMNSCTDDGCNPVTKQCGAPFWEDWDGLVKAWTDASGQQPVLSVDGTEDHVLDLQSTAAVVTSPRIFAVPDSYCLAFRARAGSLRPTMSATIFNSSGGVAQEVPPTEIRSTQDGAWQNVQTVVEVPAGAVSLSVRLGAANEPMPLSPGMAKVASVSVTRGDCPANYQDPAVAAGRAMPYQTDFSPPVAPALEHGWRGIFQRDPAVAVVPPAAPVLRGEPAPVPMPMGNLSLQAVGNGGESPDIDVTSAALDAGGNRQVCVTASVRWDSGRAPLLVSHFVDTGGDWDRGIYGPLVHPSAAGVSEEVLPARPGTTVVRRTLLFGQTVTALALRFGFTNDLRMPGNDVSFLDDVSVTAGPCAAPSDLFDTCGWDVAHACLQNSEDTENRRLGHHSNFEIFPGAFRNAPDQFLTADNTLPQREYFEPGHVYSANDPQDQAYGDRTDWPGEPTTWSWAFSPNEASTPSAATTPFLLDVPGLHCLRADVLLKAPYQFGSLSLSVLAFDDMGTSLTVPGGEMTFFPPDGQIPWRRQRLDVILPPATVAIRLRVAMGASWMIGTKTLVDNIAFSQGTCSECQVAAGLFSPAPDWPTVPGAMPVMDEMPVGPSTKTGMCETEIRDFMPNLWPDGILRYEPGDDPSYWGACQRIEMVAAMNAWSTATGNRIRFTQTAQGHRVRLAGSFNGGGAAPTGVGAGAPHDEKATLRNMGLGGLSHELGHALGMAHHHQRPDRDRFVVVRAADACAAVNTPAAAASLGQGVCGEPLCAWQTGGVCNRPSKQALLDEFAGNASARYNPLHRTAYGPYDFASVMHYDSMRWWPAPVNWATETCGGVVTPVRSCTPATPGICFMSNRLAPAGMGYLDATTAITPADAAGLIEMYGGNLGTKFRPVVNADPGPTSVLNTSLRAGAAPVRINGTPSLSDGPEGVALFARGNDNKLYFQSRAQNAVVGAPLGDWTRIDSPRAFDGSPSVIWFVSGWLVAVESANSVFVLMIDITGSVVYETDLGRPMVAGALSQPALASPGDGTKVFVRIGGDIYQSRLNAPAWTTLDNPAAFVATGAVSPIGLADGTLEIVAVRAADRLIYVRSSAGVWNVVPGSPVVTADTSPRAGALPEAGTMRIVAITSNPAPRAVMVRNVRVGGVTYWTAFDDLGGVPLGGRSPAISPDGGHVAITMSDYLPVGPGGAVPGAGVWLKQLW